MMGKKIVLGAMGLVFTLSCGTIEATPDMTMTVQPDSITFIDGSGNTNTSEDILTVSISNSEGKPAKGVKVYASVDNFFTNQGLIWFSDCGKASNCSCTTNNSGRCNIKVSYVHGNNTTYTANIIVYSGSLSSTVSLCVGAQSSDC